MELTKEEQYQFESLKRFVSKKGTGYFNSKEVKKQFEGSLFMKGYPIPLLALALSN